VKRLGCGESSGHGKTSGKGHKGQKARSGGSIRLGFEGGQMPLIRRLPKRGFNNAAFHKTYAVVNLADLNRFEAGTTVNEESLRAAKLVRGDIAGIKLLGDGELKHALKIEVDKVSAGAREKIGQAGGSVELRRKQIAPAGVEPVSEAGAAPAQPLNEGAEKSRPRALRKTPAKRAAKPKKSRPEKE
jgi:large subunit ribosomal protein L15